MTLKLKLDLADLLSSIGDIEKQKALAPFAKNSFIQREFGNRVIDKIKDRTLKGKDKNNDSMTVNTPYSKRYRDSLEFKVHGKTSRVNLKLSGQMLASMNVLSTQSTSVTLGFVSAEQDTKANRHVKGIGALPVRDFWGIDTDDQVKILKSVIRDFNTGVDLSELADIFTQAQAAAAGISGTLAKEGAA